MVEMDKKDRENRWVRSIKSNFDESDYTPIRLVLDEDRRLSFAEFEPEEDAAASTSKITKAREILYALLAAGPVQIDTIFEECDVYGIGDRTVRRAAKELGVISRSKGGITTWDLPPD